MLPKEKFQYYMVQDHKYLMQYARVFAMGLIKCTDERDMRMYSDQILLDCSYYEYPFWDMAWSMGRTYTPVIR